MNKEDKAIQSRVRAEATKESLKRFIDHLIKHGMKIEDLYYQADELKERLKKVEK